MRGWANVTRTGRQQKLYETRKGLPSGLGTKAKTGQLPPDPLIRMAASAICEGVTRHEARLWNGDISPVTERQTNEIAEKFLHWNVSHCKRICSIRAK